MQNLSNPNTVIVEITDATSVTEEAPSVPVPKTEAEPQIEATKVENTKQQEEVAPPVEAKPIAKVITPSARTPRTTLGARAPKKSAKASKLGAKKAPVNFNFEAAEAQAKRDQEQKMKYKDDEETEAKSVEPVTSSKQKSIESLSTRLAYIDAKNNGNEEEEYEKLGFGMARINDTKAMPTQKSYYKEQEETRSARDKFGSAKAISSDQFFGRNEYDPAISAAESSRLSQFSSAKAISSDQYFGRESHMDNRGYNNGDDWDDMQDQAVALARKFADQAALDLEAVKDLAENATNAVMTYFNS